MYVCTRTISAAVPAPAPAVVAVCCSPVTTSAVTQELCPQSVAIRVADTNWAPPPAHTHIHDARRVKRSLTLTGAFAYNRECAHIKCTAVGKYQSCMVSKLPMIVLCEQTVLTVLMHVRDVSEADPARIYCAQERNENILAFSLGTVLSL